MLDSPLFWPFATHFPSAFSGVALHRAALLAMSRESFDAADRLFELAAGHYRRDLMVEPLARLRVHQLIARARAGGRGADANAMALEIERRLAGLGSIESLECPFDRVDARTLLGHWAGGAAPRDSEQPGALAA
jgi:hypothetical protein